MQIPPPGTPTPRGHVSTCAGAHLTILSLHAVGEVDEQSQPLRRGPPEEVVHAGLDAGPLGWLLLQHGPHQVACCGLRDQAVQVQLALRSNQVRAAYMLGRVQGLGFRKGSSSTSLCRAVQQQRAQAQQDTAINQIHAAEPHLHLAASSPLSATPINFTPHMPSEHRERASLLHGAPQSRLAEPPEQHLQGIVSCSINGQATGSKTKAEGNKNNKNKNKKRRRRRGGPELAVIHDVTCAVRRAAPAGCCSRAQRPPRRGAGPPPAASTAPSRRRTHPAGAPAVPLGP